MKDTETVTLDSLLTEHITYSDGFNAFIVDEDDMPKLEAAILKLFEQAVESAKPEKHVHHHAYGKPFEDAQDIAYNAAIDQYQQNLLQALSNGGKAGEAGDQAE